MSKLGRNDPCHCGSGKKYKKCCMVSDNEVAMRRSVNHRIHDEQDEWEDEEMDFESEDEPEFDGNYNDEDEIEEKDENENSEDDDYDEEEEIEDDKYSKKIKDEYPEISDEEEKLVNSWWDTYKEINDPVREKLHLEKFMQDHPALVINLGLHYEMLFELGADYLKIGKYDEFIDLLMKVRREFPDSYLKSAGYYDKDIIYWLIAEGRENELPEYTDFLIEYPIDFITQLGAVKDLLFATNNYNVLFLLLEKTYKQIFESDDVLFPAEFLNLVITFNFDKYIENDNNTFNASGFIDHLKKNIEVELDEEAYSEEYWQDYFQSQLKPFSSWGDTVPKKKSQLAKLYKNIKTNYIRFIKEKTGISYPSAEYYARKIYDYLIYSMEKDRKPKKLFNFSMQELDNNLGALCKDFLYIDFTKYISILHAIYYFSDYLCTCGNINETERDKIKNNVINTHDEHIENQKKVNPETLIFSKFPHF